MKDIKGSFIMYESFAAPMEILTIEQRGLLFTAIFEYQRTGEVSTQLPDIATVAFLFIKDALDRDRQAYEEKCRKNAENGKRGGRPKREKKATDNAVPAAEAAEATEAVEVVEVVEAVEAVEAAELTAAQMEDLRGAGVPENYIRQRLGRAFSYARRCGKDVCELLLEWFRQDGKATVSKAPPSVDALSYNDWFEKRLEMTLNSYSPCPSV